MSCKILSQDNWQIGVDFVDQFEKFKFETLTNDQKKLYQEIAEYKWDHPQNFDLANCHQVLAKITNGETEVKLSNFNLVDGTRNGEKIFQPTQITIF